MLNMLRNGVMFSRFKRTDSHTVRGRPTRKGGVVIYERLFETGRSANSKYRKNPEESHDLHVVKILLETN